VSPALRPAFTVRTKDSPSGRLIVAPAVGETLAIFIAPTACAGTRTIARATTATAVDPDSILFNELAVFIVVVINTLSYIVLIVLILTTLPCAWRRLNP